MTKVIQQDFRCKISFKSMKLPLYDYSVLPIKQSSLIVSDTDTDTDA